jgi:hypothetical protein
VEDLTLVPKFAGSRQLGFREQVTAEVLMGLVKRTTAVIAVVVFAACVLAACSSSANTKLTSANVQGKWSATVPVGPRMLTYYSEFGDGTFTNFDGCNMGGGTYGVDNGKIVISDNGGTSKACLLTAPAPGDPQSYESVQIELAADPNWHLANSGKVLVVNTNQGEVRLDRVDTRPDLGM